MNINKCTFRSLDWKDLHFEIEKELPHRYMAYAKGNTIVFSVEIISQLLRGVISIYEFMFIFAHELAHIYQQSVLALNMSSSELNNYINTNRNRLEIEADFFAYEILGMKFLQETDRNPDYVNGNIPLCVYSAAPIQGWSVNGILSEFLAQRTDNDMIDELSEAYEKIMNDYTGEPLSNYLMKYKVSAQERGVHEVFTDNAIDEVLWDMQKDYKFVNSFKADKRKRESLIHGCQFNDRGHDNNFVFSIKYASIWEDSYIKQTHHGAMQFLHSMASSEGDYKIDLMKIKRWIEFCVDVFNEQKVVIDNTSKNIREVTFREYWNSLPITDIMIYMLGEMFFTWQGYRDFKKNYDEIEEYEDIYDKQLNVAVAMREFVKNNENKVFKQSYIPLAAYEGGDLYYRYSQYLDMKIGDFFSEKGKWDAGYVAIGMASHIIQDGFASSHAKRTYDLYLRYKNNEIIVMNKTKKCSDVDITNIDILDVDEGCGDIYERKREEWRDDDKRGDEQQKKFREYLIKKSMPVLLFCDYSKQDSGKHKHADLWLDYVDGQSLSDKIFEYLTQTGYEDLKADLSQRVYVYTLNAKQAKDCTEAFMYMVFSKKSKKEIIHFINALYPLAEIPKGFEPSGGGLQYEAYSIYEKMSGCKLPIYKNKAKVKQYEDFVEKTIAYNRKMDYRERLVVTEVIVEYLEKILKEEEYKSFHEFYFLHLNELTIELYEMAKQISSQKTEKYTVLYKEIYIEASTKIIKIIRYIEEIYRRYHYGEINPLVREVLQMLSER